ncbi:MAG: ribonuclease R [Xanthobacteraceae bacterium]|nr:ribonuclease R [Xanthobacteraceae bacterium]QYK43794.1 MAG: ribonuclease R [Xanthobacteraceae bacterium]
MAGLARAIHGVTTRTRLSKRPKKKFKDPKPHGALPSREELLAFITERGGDVSKRDIIRAFRLDGAGKAELKTLLRDLKDEGEVKGRHRKMTAAGHVAATVMASVVARDAEGDLLAEPLDWDEADFGAAPRIRLVFGRQPTGIPAPGIGDRVLLRTQRTEDEDDAPYAGRVIKLLEKARQQLLGIYRRMPQGGGRLVPVDKKSLGREIAIPSGMENEAQDGDLVTADPMPQRAFGLATAKVRERLGSIKSEKAVSLIAIHAHAIPNNFPNAVIAEAEAARPPAVIGREDWRPLPLVTIDPVDAKDHDDAIHAAPDESNENAGGFILTVAIADVAHYVTPDSAMDREAQLRGNSVYFPDRVVPMLPERISNDLCSLRAGEDRAAMAVRMVIDANGRKLRHSFHRILMRSRAKLSYQQAQAAIDGNPDPMTRSLVAPILQPLWAAYRALAKARDAREPLALDIPERKLVLNADGTLNRVTTPERLDAHRLIEEFMILANVAAAETAEAKRTPLIYRVHDSPSLEKAAALRDFLRTIGITLPKTDTLRPALFNNVLARVKDTEYERLVNEVVLRSQAQAEYSSNNYGHFGLTLRRYAHFTSPIRRYADLIVHRALIRALGLGNDGLPDTTPEALEEVAARISAAERRAMAAERETVDRLIAHYMADKIGASFRGVVAGVTRSGLFVKLDEIGADGFIPARTIGNEFFAYHEALQALIGDRSGEAYRLGDRVEVKLVEAVPVAGALRFELLSEGRYDLKATRKSRSNGPRGHRGSHAPSGRQNAPKRGKYGRPVSHKGGKAGSKPGKGKGKRR